MSMQDLKPNSSAANQALERATSEQKDQFETQASLNDVDAEQISTSLQACTSKIKAKYQKFHRQLEQQTKFPLDQEMKDHLLDRYINGDAAESELRIIKAIAGKSTDPIPDEMSECLTNEERRPTRVVNSRTTPTNGAPDPNAPPRGLPPDRLRELMEGQGLNPIGDATRKLGNPVLDEALRRGRPGALDAMNPLLRPMEEAIKEGHSPEEVDQCARDVMRQVRKQAEGSPAELLEDCLEKD